MFGRSPDFFNATLPSQLICQWFFEESNIPVKGIPKHVRHKFTVAGTVPEFHQIPF